MGKIFFGGGGWLFLLKVFCYFSMIPLSIFVTDCGLNSGGARGGGARGGKCLPNFSSAPPNCPPQDGFILHEQLMALRNFKTSSIYWVLLSVVLCWFWYETVKKAHKYIISALLNHSLPGCSKVCSQDENATDTAKTILPPKNFPLRFTCPPPQSFNPDAATAEEPLIL